MVTETPRWSGFTYIRGVALFEAVKGSVVILAGFGLLSLIHHDLQAVAEQFVASLHLNPAKHLGRIFIEAAANLNDTRLLLLALMALFYAVLRYIEAYGLWFGKRWAEWLAVVSGGVYVVVEAVELSRGFAWLKVFSLVANLVVVAYLCFVLSSKNNPITHSPE